MVSRLVARFVSLFNRVLNRRSPQAHNPKVVGSNPPPATKKY